MKSMDHRILLNFLKIAERLKCNTRHSWTSSGRHESVAEHTYRLCVFAWLVRKEFPECDMERVMQMCLFHDLGEAVTGDIPCFEKEDIHRKTEAEALEHLTEFLQEPERSELQGLFREIEENQTNEAHLVHALDKMEAVIQHNEASIRTWIPLEYDLQMTYGQEQVMYHPYLKELRNMIGQDSLEKIREEKVAAKENAGYQVKKGVGNMDPRRVVELLHATDWAKDRSEEKILGAMEHSFPYAVFDSSGYMAGYARVMTDEVTTYYLMDVVIDEKYREKGLSRMLMDAILEDYGHLYGILHTENAEWLYQKYGFQIKNAGPEMVMERPGVLSNVKKGREI